MSQSEQNLLTEYETTCIALVVVEGVVEKIRVLKEDLEKQLDAATSPVRISRTHDVRENPENQDQQLTQTDLPQRFRCDGRWVRTYESALRWLVLRSPGNVLAIESALSEKGRARRYLARSPRELFTGKGQKWCEEHSKQLIPGWYIDTNHSRSKMKELLEIAVEATGLVLGVDVLVDW